MTAETRTCARPDCGTTFTPTDRRQTYCMKACAMKARTRRLLGKDGRGNYPARECERPDCRASFTPLTKTTRYCSSRCLNTMMSRTRNGTPLDGVFADRDCLACGTRFTPQKTTSRHCSYRCQASASEERREAARRAALRPLVARACASPTCANQFVPSRRGSARQRFCASAPCIAERQRVRLLDPVKRIKQRDAVHLKGIQQRMREAGNTAAFDKSVTTTACIARFGTQCHWCGQEMNVDRTLASKQRGDSVTIDHLLPITKNGPHTWENVVLACRRCNTEKHNDVCQSCRGPITSISEPVCAKCAAKGRKPKVGHAVCRDCGYVELPSGWCDRCRAKGAGIWIATGLTKRAAFAMSRELGFDPTGPLRPPVTEWVAWVA